MSAYMVDKLVIDLLIRAALRSKRDHDTAFRWWRVNEDGSYAGWRELDPLAEGVEDPSRHPAEYMVQCSPSAAGQILCDENLRSINHRYPDTVEGGLVPGPVKHHWEPYVYEDPGYTMTPAEVFATIDHLDYQSCEHPGWMTSEAFEFLRKLRERYCKLVEGYDEAPWGWHPEDLQERFDRMHGLRP